MKLLLKISILTFICIFALNSHAQIPTATIDGVTIQTSSDNPKPGEDVDISVESYNFDLNAASIVWLVNGKVQGQGIGIKQITITTPAIGQKIKVVANIKTAAGREVQKTLTIGSASVDIVWESNGYTPPFFKGKTPFSYQNSVKLIAVPHLSQDGKTETDPKKLVYSWKNNGKYIDNGQGYGKQSVEIIADDIPKTLEISVDVSNREQTEHSIGYLTLTPTEPTLSFYEDDSLYGILFNKSLGDKVQLKNTEMKILAIPYGFNLQNNSTTYGWSVNNIDQSDLNKNRSITVRSKGDTDGSSNIYLDMRNDENFLQGARGGFTIYFTKKKNALYTNVF